jgi:hypothetical protein
VPELGGKNPLMLLNDLRQSGKISNLSIADPAKDSAGFVARITCKVYAEWLESVGHGPNKRDAQRKAAESLIELLATPVEGHNGDRGAPAAPEFEADAGAGAMGAHRNPAGPLAGRDEAAAAEEGLVELLRQGLEITIDVQDGAGRFLLYRVDGTAGELLPQADQMLHG